MANTRIEGKLIEKLIVKLQLEDVSRQLAPSLKRKLSSSLVLAPISNWKQQYRLKCTQ